MRSRIACAGQTSTQATQAHITSARFEHTDSKLSDLPNLRARLAEMRIETDRARAHNNLGCVYLAEGKMEKAAQCFHKAIEINPTFYVKANENLQKVGVANFN